LRKAVFRAFVAAVLVSIAFAFYDEATQIDYGGPHGAPGFDVLRAIENLSFTWGIGLVFFLGAIFNMLMSRNDSDAY
jgi:formate/nitrite transporter FocA (FNT family)